MENFRFGEVRDIHKDVDDTRTITFVASTENKDRHNTIIKADIWDIKAFNKNPIIGYQHDIHGDMCTKADPDDIIGKGKARAEGKELLVDITFVNVLLELIYK